MAGTSVTAAADGHGAAATIAGWAERVGPRVIRYLDAAATRELDVTRSLDAFGLTVLRGGEAAHPALIVTLPCTACAWSEGAGEWPRRGR